MITEKQAALSFVNIRDIDSRIRLDIRYATSNNFLGFAVYPKAVCYLHLTVARALSQVQNELEKEGLCLKIYDGYRPLPIQQVMWDMIQDERYVSNPAKNKGRHSRGTAVDLTLIDFHERELEMPTEFDQFTEKAHSHYLDLSPHVIQNRTLLKNAMNKQHFIQNPTEWWHFDFEGWNQDSIYPPLSFSFEELETLRRNE